MLSTPVDVTPWPFSTEKLTSSIVGKSVRLVGYGASIAGAKDGTDGFGIKRTLTSVETIIGVDSFSDADADCTASENYQRLDVEADFIMKFLAAPTNADPARNSNRRSSSTRRHQADRARQKRRGHRRNARRNA